MRAMLIKAIEYECNVDKVLNGCSVEKASLRINISS